jgi:imidazolonepropionase-like amidohydrolase
MALVGVTLIDGTGRPARPNQTVVIKGEKIVAIVDGGGVALAPGMRVLDLQGRYLVPGLIDAHVHVATDPLKEDTRIRTEQRLRKSLLGGVTAVRDMAGDVRSLAALQRDAELGEIAGPDIYYVALFAGPAFFADPRTHDASRGLVAGRVPWMRAVTDTTDIRQAVAEARGTGATAIKLYAALNGELARKVTSEAHRQSLAVWSHAALRPATPIEVIHAGVDAVSHAVLLTRDTLDPGLDSLFLLMKRQRIALEPTLLVFADNPARLSVAGAITRRAHRAGVTILAGTDTLAGVDADTLALPNLHRELDLLVRVGGLSPAEALTSATRNNAAVLKAADSRGTIEVGKLADLVVLSADPLADIRNTGTVELVVKRGRVYRR